SLTAFGIALDFVCVVFSFVILYAALAQLIQRPFYVAAASIAMLFSPWIYSEAVRWTLPGALSAHISTVSHTGFPSPAVLRGVYTQLSYPIFILGFYCIVRGQLSPPRSLVWYSAAGAAGGLLAY